MIENGINFMRDDLKNKFESYRRENMLDNFYLREIKNPREEKFYMDKKLRDILDFSPVSREVDPIKAYAGEEVKGCPIEGNGGYWEGIRGNSKWLPIDREVPLKNNPENLNWKEIKNKYGIDGIRFENGEPDFSEVSVSTLEIDDFTESREENFYQADMKLAKEQGKTVSEIRNWRKENNYTWHECSDCKTLQLVPSEIHGNISHQGGIAEIKKRKGLV